MNRIYRLIWSVIQHAWVVAGELTRSHKKTKLLCSITVLIGSLGGSTFAAEGTQHIELKGDGTTESLSPVTGLDGTEGTFQGDDEDAARGSAGSTAYIVSTSLTDKDKNKVIVEQGITISGGNGGASYSGDLGALGGEGIQGDNFSM